MTPKTPRDAQAQGADAAGRADADGLAGLAPGRDASDLQLQRALRALPADATDGEIDALAARVLLQWHERRAHTAAPVMAAQGVAAALGVRLWRRRLWLGTASLALAAVVVAVVIVNKPDPVLEELMQPDVLSQMAIGEM